MKEGMHVSRLFFRPLPCPLAWQSGPASLDIESLDMERWPPRLPLHLTPPPLSACLPYLWQSDSTSLDMESEFLSLGLDIIGLGVFNYDFGSINSESPVIKVWGGTGLGAGEGGGEGRGKWAFAWVRHQGAVRYRVGGGRGGG
eukprot:358853-Chlamydomonas_euryale.AAC.1